jgi:uncharacterized protein YqjF (DUF2071 family)
MEHRRATILGRLILRTFLTAEWRDLVLFSFEAPPLLFEPFLPRGVALDDWHGRAFFSLIGFRFLKSRLLGVPIPLHGNFPEVNLRFYVRRQTPEGLRRGVVFLQEMVPKQAVATLARRLYCENYVRVPMTQVVEPGRSAKYTWKTAGQPNWIAARTVSAPAVPASDSLETFIVDHHWGYTRTRDGGCIEYQVERPPWRVCLVESFEMRVDSDLPLAIPATPDSVIFAEGSEVAVSFGKRIA